MKHYNFWKAFDRDKFKTPDSLNGAIQELLTMRKGENIDAEFLETINGKITELQTVLDAQI